MADNMSCDPKVSSPDYLFSSMKIGDREYPDKGFDGSFDYLNLNWEWKSYNKMMSQSQDILDLLPSDPFDMNISGGCAMIRGWIEEIDEGIVEDETDDDLFSRLNLVLTEATRIRSGVGDIKIGAKSIGDNSSKENLDVGCDGLCKFDGRVGSCNEKFFNFSNNDDKHLDCDGNGNGNGAVGAPSDALFFALGHLGVKDLLSVERVCKSLREGVQNDPLLWRSIHIDQPPGDTFTDESFLRLTSRANGSLQSLSLVKCFKITDNGLKTVFQTNPGLTKVSVAGCVGLSVGGLVSNIKALKAAGGAGIKRLRINGLLGLTTDHYEELKRVLSSADNQSGSISPKPRFYHSAEPYLSFEDERVLDMEPCPKCHQIRQVYDCPSETCQGEGRSNHCRACTLCIARCINCGCCFNERDYMETFCLDFLCLDCLTHFLNFPEPVEEDPKQPVLTQQARYHFCLYG